MTDSAADFDGAFFAEIARLLPDVDVVIVRRTEPGEPVAPEEARRRIAAEASRLASVLAAGWPDWFEATAHPDVIRLRWVGAGEPGVVSAEASARCPGLPAPGDAGSDPGRLAVVLGDDGWATTVREQGDEGSFRVVARCHGARLDIVVRPAEGLTAVRVTGDPLALGGFGERLAGCGVVEAPWPPPRTA